MSKKRSQSNTMDWSVPHEHKFCETCDSKFMRLKNRSEKQWNAHNFCSVECRLKTKARYSDKAKRFHDNYIPEPNSGCWLWTGSINNEGYGQISINMHHMRSNRLAYEVCVGPIPDDMIICHRCDNPSCVNPEHLYAGTHQDNANDKAQRGRGIQGETHHQSKLKESDVKFIRSSKEHSRALAAKFCVSPVTIRAIRSRKTWSHL